MKNIAFILIMVIKVKVRLVNTRWIHLEDSLPPVNIYCWPLHQTVQHSGGHIPIIHGLINTPHGGAEGEGRMLMTQGAFITQQERSVRDFK